MKARPKRGFRPTGVGRTMLAALAMLVVGCTPVAPIAVSGRATEGLPELQEQTLTIARGGGSDRQETYVLKRQPDGYWRVETVDVMLDKPSDPSAAADAMEAGGEPPRERVRGQYGDAAWRRVVIDPLFTGDKIRIYDIDPATFGLAEIATAIGRDNQALLGQLQARAQRGVPVQMGDLAFFNGGPAPAVPQRFLLITTEFADSAWNADGEPTALGAKLATLQPGLAIPAAPRARFAALVPRGVTMRATDLAFAGSFVGEKDMPRGVATCLELKAVPKWIAQACLANFAERQASGGPRWQGNFSGLVADDPDQLRAGLRKLGRGILDNEIRRDETTKPPEANKPVLEGMIRVL